MRYCAIFHANLNYAFLEPHKYERTIRASYETIIDTFREKHPSAKYVFEASGYTIEKIAEVTPDVLKKLKDAVASGQCEFMGSPYAHPMLANFPEEDGRWASEFAQRAYEKHLGFRAESAWNPECSWTQYVPRTFRDAGFRYLTLDFESYKICNDKEYGWVERNRARDMGWGATCRGTISTRSIRRCGGLSGTSCPASTASAAPTGSPTSRTPTSSEGSLSRSGSTTSGNGREVRTTGPSS
jgi:hypothetical protein